MEDLAVSSTLIIPSLELEWSAVRSSGPGGQNVNKVSTKVLLRFDPRSPSLPSAVAERLRLLASARLDTDGRIVFRCDATRSQVKNLDLARERLAALIRKALIAPKRRRPTRPSAGQQRARLDDKRRTSRKKDQRRQGGWD